MLGVIEVKQGLMTTKPHCSRGGVYVNRNLARKLVEGGMTEEGRRAVGEADGWVEVILVGGTCMER